MSRIKKTSPRERRPAAHPQPARTSRWYQRRWLWLAVTVAGITVIVVGVYSEQCRRSARSDYARARELFSSDPEAAERFAEGAVMNAGGDFPAAQLLQCRALAATGQWDAALGGLSLIKDFTTCDAEDLTSLGEAAVEAGQWRLAETSLDHAALKNTGESSSRAMELLVRLDLRFQRPDDALRRCRTWQHLFPDAPQPWAMAGDIKTAAVDLGAAIHDYRQALRRSPPADLARLVRSSLVQLLVHTGDTAGARLEFDKLLASGPLNGKLQLSYVQLLRLEGRQADALAEVDDQISQSGKTPEALKLRGIVQLDGGNVAAALQDLKESVQGNPLDIGAQYKLGQAYLQSGDPDSAQPHLERSRTMTEATYRIPEVEELLQQDPANLELQQELRSLRAILRQ